ncbi:MAG: cellulase [Acidobacteriaceae bacterium]|nr:cellulase [Acidobacteriaceae bacterium]
MTRRSLGGVALAGAASYLLAPSFVSASSLKRCSAHLLTASWPLWEAYTSRFLDSGGRIVDHDDHDRTTSEGQAYALFFALVANDRQRFAQLLSWTEQNLAHGELASRLPAWLWGSQGETWGVLDENSASDADLWLAYTLLEAGRLWKEPRYKTLGEALSRSIADNEVQDLPGLGPMLLPGPSGFVTADGFYQLNPSYLPLQVLLGLSNHLPQSPWSRIAQLTPRVIRSSAPAGFVMDWIAYRPGDGFAIDPVPRGEPLSSYDAIRVYLWAGMLAPGSAYREQLLEASSGIVRYMQRNSVPPAQVQADGEIRNAEGNIGFSAALIPLLTALHQNRSLEEQKVRLTLAKHPATGLYGSEPRYYDQNLALFAVGWQDGRFCFDKQGLLQVSWR